MDIYNILPIIIIGIFVQILVMVYYIKNCMGNDILQSKQKWFWIVIILLFNVPGAAAYLYFTRRKTIDYSTFTVEESIDKNIRDCIFLCLIYAFEILSLENVVRKAVNPIIFILLALFLAVSILGHYFASKKIRLLYYLMPGLEVLLVVAADYLSASNDYRFLIFVVVAIIINDYPLQFSKIFMFFPLSLYLLSGISKMASELSVLTSDDVVGFTLTNSVKYFFIFSMFYIAKKQLILNNRLQFLMHELKEKTQKLEEMSILRERNRIAREIHDTLGHTLTGAIVKLEVAKKLVHINKDKALETIEETQNITRLGFQDVKHAIKALRPIIIEENSLQDALDLLFERTERGFQFAVSKKVKLPAIISNDVKVCVYRITQELITNSIRHGHADSMELSIDYENNIIRINTKDNGKGCNVINEGYGLAGIRERVSSFDGQVYFSSKLEEGFTSFITIPIKKK